MGVTIRTHDGEKRVDLTYSGVDRIRSWLVQAYFKYLNHILQTELGGRTDYSQEEYDTARETENEPLLRECRYKQLFQLFHPILERPSLSFYGMTIDIGLNYTALRKLAEENPSLLHAIPGFIGLYKFVNHSDCEGYHSRGDCVDIVEMLTLIKPHIKDVFETEFKDAEMVTSYEQLVEDIRGVFDEALEKQTYVEYR
jgi:hypothetical protein